MAVSILDMVTTACISAIASTGVTGISAIASTATRAITGISAIASTATRAITGILAADSVATMVITHAILALAPMVTLITGTKTMPAVLGQRLRSELFAAIPAVHRVRASPLRLIVVVSLVVMLSACATYGERVAPVPLPETQAAHVDVDGVKILAQDFANDREARDAFGFDIRGAGLLPVRLVIDNQSQGEVRVSPDQSFLIDAQGQAWPLLRAEQAYERVRSHVELGETAKGAGRPALLLGAAGAIVGAAIGIVAGHDIGETVGKSAAVGAAAGALSGGARQYEELDGRIKRDLVQESLRNSRIRSGELAYGYLFFPGIEEAKSASVLRLGLDVGGERRVGHVPL